MRTLPLALMALMAPLAPLARTTASEPPSTVTVLQVLIHAGSRPLPTSRNSFCDAVAPGETLGDYLAALVGHGALEPAEEATRSLTLSCADGAANLEIFPGQFVADADQHWICTLASSSLDRFSGDGWNYELRFLLRKRDLRLDRKRMWCPGAP